MLRSLLLVVLFLSACTKYGSYQDVTPQFPRIKFVAVGVAAPCSGSLRQGDGEPWYADRRPWIVKRVQLDTLFELPTVFSTYSLPEDFKREGKTFFGNLEPITGEVERIACPATARIPLQIVINSVAIEQ
jgi:hypothetical protein